LARFDLRLDLLSSGVFGGGDGGCGGGNRFCAGGGDLRFDPGDDLRLGVGEDFSSVSELRIGSGVAVVVDLVSDLEFEAHTSMRDFTGLQLPGATGSAPSECLGVSTEAVSEVATRGLGLGSEPCRGCGPPEGGSFSFEGSISSLTDFWGFSVDFDLPADIVPPSLSAFLAPFGRTLDKTVVGKIGRQDSNIFAYVSHGSK
jgi:hypothetical protein